MATSHTAVHDWRIRYTFIARLKTSLYVYFCIKCWVWWNLCCVWARIRWGSYYGPEINYFKNVLMSVAAVLFFPNSCNVVFYCNRISLWQILQVILTHIVTDCFSVCFRKCFGIFGSASSRRSCAFGLSGSLDASPGNASCSGYAADTGPERPGRPGQVGWMRRLSGSAALSGFMNGVWNWNHSWTWYLQCAIWFKLSGSSHWNIIICGPRSVQESRHFFWAGIIHLHEVQMS